jgi:hypothetical protein
MLTACAASVWAVPVEDWVTAGGSTTITDGSTNSPTFTPADGLQVIGGFSNIAINDGEFIRLTATMQINSRTDDLNLTDAVRIGLFRTDDENETVIQGTELSGIILEHRDQIRELRLNAQTGPFASGTQSFVIGSTSGDPESDPPPAQTIDDVTFEFMLQIERDGEEMEISGTIGDGGAFKEFFTRADYNTPMDNPPNNLNEFRWNRAGFLIGGNVGATSVNMFNVEVTSGVAAEEDADFDGDDDVDGADFLLWQRGVGGANGTAPVNGNANGDAFVDGADLAIWEAQFGTATANAAAVPEPESLVLGGMALAGAAGAAVRRRRSA